MSSCPLLIFSLFLIISLFNSIKAQTPRIRGLLLDCGAVGPTETADGLLWLPDYAFIATGVTRNLSLPGLLPTLSTLRSFPSASQGRRKFCYNVPVFRGSRYLVRTTYFYGGINGPGDPPVFDQIVDGTFWTVVNTTADYVAGAASSYEAVFLARGTKMKVCVAKNDYTDSDPFINNLEMIVLEDSVYNSTDFTQNALGLIARSRFGYDGPIVRYPDDRFDRYWQAFIGNGKVLRNAQNASASNLWNLPPESVFSTALTSDGDNNMELPWPPISLPNSSYYIALYFADMSNGNSRTFDVFINGYAFYQNLELTSSGLVVFANEWNLSGLTRISLWSESVSLPVISAGEVFGVFSIGGITATRDVIALEKLKKSIGNIPLDWDGDPCLPHEYSWTGITCSNGSQIRVVSLNLSSMGLSGFLPPTIANLTALTDLSFANNNISGRIPDLSQLRRLERLHLQDNHFDGNIPSSLGNLTSLRELFLENNNLTGQIPSSLLNKPGLNLRLSPGNNFTSAPSVG